MEVERVVDTNCLFNNCKEKRNQSGAHHCFFAGFTATTTTPSATISVSPAHCYSPQRSHSHSHSTSRPPQPATAHPHTTTSTTTHSRPYYSQAGSCLQNGGFQVRPMLMSRPCSPAAKPHGSVHPARSDVPAGRVRLRRRV